jgi:hypothetical protein
MTGNNFAGARSVIYGKTIDHVLEAGTSSLMVVQPLPAVEKSLLEQKMRGQTLRRRSTAR